MPEPASHRDTARQTRIWTDKRPIAPDFETQITCALAEARAEASSFALVLLMIGLPFFLNSNTHDADLSNPIYLVMAVIFLGVYLLAAVVSCQHLPNSNGQALAFRSGIPQSNTRLSRVIFWFLMILAVACLGALLAHLQGADWPKPLSNNLGMVMAVGIACSGLYAARRIQELLLWVLELRAGQGHGVSFASHPMAAPIVVEDNWWKKPAP